MIGEVMFGGRGILAALISALIVAIPAEAQSSITIGETAILSAGDNGNGNLLAAQETALSETATIESLSFYVAATGGRLRLGIYDASGPGGGPGALKAETSSFTPATGWNTANVVTPIQLAAGNYWLAYLPSSNGLNFRKTNASGNCEYFNYAYGSLPGQFSTSPNSCKPTIWSFYATLTASGGASPVNGACGSANGVAVSTSPTANLCASGSASGVSGTGPWSWTCAGANGGATAQCAAALAASPVNGACGSASGTTVSTAPTANLCTAGVASAVSGAGPWSWNCAGSNGGSPALCSALLASSSGSGTGSAAGSTGALPSGVTLSAIDGETLAGTTNTLTYFSDTNAVGAQFNANSAWLNKQIAIGVWEEQPISAAEVGYDIAMGNNLYVNLAGPPSCTNGCGTVDYNVIRAGGMHAIAPNEDANTGSETVGWLGGDEPDLNLGPGSGPYSNSSGDCTTSTACGYTAVQLWYTGSAPGATGTQPYPIDNRALYTGDGKGVLQFESDPPTANSPATLFLKWSDINAADNYWFTDTNDYGANNPWGACQAAPSSTACDGGNGIGFTAAQAELAVNYESNVTVLRAIQKLNGLPSKPIYAYVETGCPGSEGNCVTPAQFTAAAWHVLIAGARGVIWFQHNFSGPCVDFNTFYDGSNPNAGSNMYNCEITPGETLANLVQAVTAVNAEINSLSPVLLSPFANGYVTAAGTVSVMAKYYNSTFYVFAGSGQPGTLPPANQSVTFTLAGSPTGTVTVVNESRTIALVNGKFTDTFANANTVHIYQIN
jgi:hypothetical protein